MGREMYENPYQTEFSNEPSFAYQAREDERTAFIRRTYLHLAGAVAMFVAIQALIFTVVPAATLQNIVTTVTAGYAWIGIMVAFMAVSWVANWWALSGASPQTQYAGLFLYVIAESLLFVPLLYIAQVVDPAGNIIPTAGLLTCIVFGGLTAMVFVTRADFSWLGKFLFWAGIVAVGAVICFAFLGTGPLGLVFCVAMIGLASGYILYDTSNILHHYRTDQHVAASLALFASVALLFWYIIRLVMEMQRD